LSVTLHDGAIDQFFRSTSGEMARYIRKRSTKIKALTARNMSAHFRDGGMIVGLQIKGPFPNPTGVYELVGSDATKPWSGHQPFNYPIALELGFPPASGPGKSTAGDYHYPMIIPAVEDAGFSPIA